MCPFFGHWCTMVDVNERSASSLKTTGPTARGFESLSLRPTRNAQWQRRSREQALQLLDSAENALTPVMPITSHPMLRHLSAF
jgi:hypothetical protein